MGDVTYRVTCEEQIKSNANLSIYEKRDLLFIAKQLSDNYIKDLAKTRAYRFFYKEPGEELFKKLTSDFDKSQKNTVQRYANRQARAGKNTSLLEEGFPTSYTKAGHKYVDGRRVY